MKNKFLDRDFEEVKGGYYEDDFYITPNGSFWDPDGYYFNREGFDKHGGYYDKNNEYIPGDSWDSINECYKSEIEGDYEEDDEENLDDEDDYEDFKNIQGNYEDDDDILDEEKLILNDPSIERVIINQNDDYYNDYCNERYYIHQNNQTNYYIINNYYENLKYPELKNFNKVSQFKNNQEEINVYDNSDKLIDLKDKINPDKEFKKNLINSFDKREENTIKKELELNPNCRSNNENKLENESVNKIEYSKTDNNSIKIEQKNENILLLTKENTGRQIIIEKSGKLNPNAKEFIPKNSKNDINNKNLNSRNSNTEKSVYDENFYRNTCKTQTYSFDSNYQKNFRNDNYNKNENYRRDNYYKNYNN